ncbi:MAG: DUF72 domain-containing protein [Tumebacillaceae bacterium]
MIQIGLTGWGSHPELYPSAALKRNKLQAYASHFPIVEVDNTFYAIQPATSYEKWTNDTPANFSFVIKAYQGMTGHLRGNIPFDNPHAMFDAFLQSIQPMLRAGKVKAVLFQYPPWFECNRTNVDMLRWAREKMRDVPVALEFRNQTWFTPGMREKTLQFMEREGWVHSICDEPQVGSGSVPTVLHPTHRQLTLVRFHGRNSEGWSQSEDANWREVRYLYRYSRDELTEWKANLLQLQKSTEEICLIFNNNSGGDAAANAKELMHLLGVEYEGLAPRQLDLFGLE